MHEIADCPIEGYWRFSGQNVIRFLMKLFQYRLQLELAMTIAARKVLEDCLGAIEEIDDGVQGSAWRRRWVAAVVLLRTVGHVLKSVDSKTSTRYRKAIDDAWCQLKESKPQPDIFWGFIDAERNNIVHEYEVGAGQGVVVYPGQDKPADCHYLINGGPFTGQDQRDVLRAAVQWLEVYLDDIDTAALE